MRIRQRNINMSPPRGAKPSCSGCTDGLSSCSVLISTSTSTLAHQNASPDARSPTDPHRNKNRTV